MGKGSTRRPGDEAALRANWDATFGKKPARYFTMGCKRNDVSHAFEGTTGVSLCGDVLWGELDARVRGLLTATQLRGERICDECLGLAEQAPERGAVGA